MSRSKEPNEAEYTTVSESEFKQHLTQFLEALTALGPTRNHTSQLLYLLPEDHDRMKEAYPELLKDGDSAEFLKGDFGLKVNGSKLEARYRTANRLNSIIEDTLRFFSDADRRQALEAYLDDEIPNPHREWVDRRVQMAVDNPEYGSEVKTVLRTMLDEGDPKLSYCVEWAEMESSTDIDTTRLTTIRGRLIDDFEICYDADERFEFTDDVEQYRNVIERHC